MTSILSALPTIGPVGLLLVVVVWVARLWMGAEARHKSELQRVNAAHDEELEELRADIKELREQVDIARKLSELERQQRYAAEEKAHRIAMEMSRFERDA